MDDKRNTPCVFCNGRGVKEFERCTVCKGTGKYTPSDYQSRLDVLKDD